MKGRDWLLAFVMGMILPALVFSMLEKAQMNIGSADNSNPTTETVESVPNQTEILPQNTVITVLHTDGSLERMNLDTYLTGVVLGEMPVDFHEQALKAQAVVARTYTLKRTTTGKKHAFGDVCTESSCCQAYCSADDYLDMGGTREGLNKVMTAVYDTTNQVLMYQNALIEATYFSCSGGRTEDALAVWGTEIPYLQAVDSPGEENATHYTDSVQFSANEFASALGISSVDTPSKWLGAVTYTSGGGVATIEIAGVIYKGTTLREKLGLRSTAFSILLVGNDFHISTKGFGHRVGMSQYGAEAMAVNGSDYAEILAHYYSGALLKTYSQN